MRAKATPILALWKEVSYCVAVVTLGNWIQRTEPQSWMDTNDEIVNLTFTPLEIRKPVPKEITADWFTKDCMAT